MKTDSPTLKCVFSIALVATIAVLGTAHAAPSPATAAAGSQKVVKVRGKAPQAYRLELDQFKRTGPIASGDIVLPTPVLAVSPKGFVQVQGVTGPIWLDKFAVDLFPREAPSARVKCLPEISASADVTGPVTRGAGEGC